MSYLGDKRVTELDQGKGSIESNDNLNCSVEGAQKIIDKQLGFQIICIQGLWVPKSLERNCHMENAFGNSKCQAWHCQWTRRCDRQLV